MHTVQILQPLLFSLTVASLVLGVAKPAPAVPVAAVETIIPTAKTAQALPLKDGVYFFGEAATADQVGRGYVVFSQRQGKVVGALYHPRSDYSCFIGTVHSQQLNITSYGMEDERLQLQIPLERLYQIRGLSEVGQQTLAACQQEIATREAMQQPYAQQPKALVPQRR